MGGVLHLWKDCGEHGMDSCGYEKGRQRREHQPLPVLGKLVVAAMKAKVQRDGPIAAWLRMENVPEQWAALASAYTAATFTTSCRQAQHGRKHLCANCR